MDGRREARRFRKGSVMRLASRVYVVVAAASVLALAGGSVMAAAAPSGQAAPRAARAAGPGLPLDRYMVPDAKVTAVVVAQTELEVACLRSLGIHPDSGVASVLPTLPAGLGPVLGSLSASQSAASGYASLAAPAAGTITYVDGLGGGVSRPPAAEHAALFGTIARVGG